MKKFIFCLIILFSFFGLTKANSITGGEITYEHVGTATQPYLYKIKLNVYRPYQPGVISYDTTMSITINSTCFGSSTMVLKRLVPSPAEAAGDGGFAIERAYNCIDPADTNALHISAHKYEDTLTLPGMCSDYTFSYTGCCRDTGLSNYLSPTSNTMYLEAMLNYTGNSFTPNSSINFDTSPLVNICLNSKAQLSFGAKDANGDSLHYEILRPATGKNSFLNWAVGYTNTNPVQNSNGFSFSQRDGIMGFTPAIPEKVALRIRVTEYHYGNIFPMFFIIGSTTREIVLNITSSCANTSPSSLFYSDASNIDTSAKFYCNDNIIKLKLNHEIQVDKIAKDGSNFRLTDVKNNAPNPITEAGALNPVYSGLYTKEIWIKTFLPITRNDTFDLSIKPGLQGTKLISSCEHEFTSGTVRLVVDDCLPVFGMTEANLKNKLKAYPNPVSNLLTLEIPDRSFEGNMLFNIYDVSGKLIGSPKALSNKGNKVEINCEHLKPDIYLLQLNQPDRHSYVIKIIKE